VRYILHGRPRKVTRAVFFEESTYAIIGTISRKAARTFCGRVTQCGFPWKDYKTVATWPQACWKAFFTRLYPPDWPGFDYKEWHRGREKWDAVRHIAELLAGYQSDHPFQVDFFGGKSRSADLDHEDVNRLRAKRLRFIGSANSQYVVRNMGGETIKCDRWIQEFFRYFHTTAPAIKAELKGLEISLSLFDVVVWAYCEAFVKRVADFRAHFQQLLSEPTPP
jgi:hypothetical protein